MSKDIKRVARRPVRKRLSRKGKLYSEARPGFTQRWANDRMGNIEELMELGYKPRVKEKDGSVLDKEKEGTLQGGGTFSNAITKRVGVDDGGREIIAVLMEIPTDLYEEMQAEKQLDVDAMEGHLKPEQTSDTYGSMSLEATRGNKDV